MVYYEDNNGFSGTDNTGDPWKSCFLNEIHKENTNFLYERGQHEARKTKRNVPVELFYMIL